MFSKIVNELSLGFEVLIRQNLWILIFLYLKKYFMQQIIPLLINKCKIN